jgi:hypothetical protein
LTMSDSHTLRVPVAGITYIPIPPAAGATLPGLISVELPLGIRKGQGFNVLVRQVTSATTLRLDQVARRQSWRRVLGSFQIAISVTTKGPMLAPEERSLSVMRWIQLAVPAGNRWFPVIQRYLDQIAARVSALGGNPASILPSPSGGIRPLPPPGPPRPAPMEFTGKVDGVKYDAFGDFEGFFIRTEPGAEHWFASRERAVESLALRAWTERIRITVFATRAAPHRPESIILRDTPRPSWH